MMYVGTIAELIVKGIYRVSILNKGSCMCTSLERSDSIEYKVDDEVVLNELMVGSSQSYIIVGYYASPDSTSVISDVFTHRDYIESLKGINAQDGDVIIKPRSLYAGNETYIGLLACGVGVLQAGSNAWLTLSEAGKGALRCDFFNTITSVYSHKALTYADDSVALHSLYTAQLGVTPFMEEVRGYIAEQPSMNSIEGVTKENGYWLRMNNWLVGEIDDSGTQITLDLVDNFTGTSFSTTVERKILISKTKFELTFGTQSISMDSTGITLTAGASEIKMTAADGIIDAKGNAINLKGTANDETFVQVTNDNVNIKSAGTSATVLGSPLTLSSTVTFNRVGASAPVRNFYYDTTSQRWNFDVNLSVRNQPVVDERFLMNRWTQVMTELDRHTHPTPGLGSGFSGPPTVPIFWLLYGYVPLVDRKLFTSSLV